MAKIDKARYWVAVLYQENMREDWQDEIGNIVQVPYAYCCHTEDKDTKSEHRKDHTHLILAFPNTTTYKHAMEVFNLLSAEGKQALNTCQAVIGIRNVYDYLIHDTEDCRKKGKELYPPEARITGNNFDIGAYEQLGVEDKNRIFLELLEAIRKNGIYNNMDFYEYILLNYDDMSYIEVMRTYSAEFERKLNGNYHRLQDGRLRPSQGSVSESVSETHARHTPDTLFSCPFCGSIDVKKNGQTVAGSQRWRCNDCGKSWVE